MKHYDVEPLLVAAGAAETADERAAVLRQSPAEADIAYNHFQDFVASHQMTKKQPQ